MKMEYPTGWEDEVRKSVPATPDESAAGAREAFAAIAALHEQMAHPIVLTPAHPELFVTKRRKAARKTPAKATLAPAAPVLDSIGTVAAAAAMMGVSEQMIRRYLAAGAIDGKPVGGWAVDLASVATLAEAKASKKASA